MRSVRLRNASGGLILLATAATTMHVVVGCATGTDAFDVSEAGVVDDGAVRDVNVLPSKDAAPGEDTGTLPEEDSGGGCTQKVVINELMVNGPSGAEFVELYNPNTCAVPLGGWRVAYRAENNNPGGASHTFATGDSILAKAFLVVATASFAGKKDATFNGGFGNNGGQVALLDDTTAVVDKLGYGTGTTGDYTDAPAVAAPPTNQSVGRKVDGVDTDDNKADFAILTTPTPGAAN